MDLITLAAVAAVVIEEMVLVTVAVVLVHITNQQASQFQHLLENIKFTLVLVEQELTQIVVEADLEYF
tara:strand:+ start:514 stop:717 length:204 start_codon:yes stop_codon:yes gene_type:complete